jgi:hypothetical protein
LPGGIDKNHETLIRNGSDLNPGPHKYEVQCNRYIYIYIYIYVWGLTLSRVNVETDSSFRSLKIGLSSGSIILLDFMTFSQLTVTFAAFLWKPDAQCVFSALY